LVGLPRTPPDQNRNDRDDEDEGRAVPVGEHTEAQRSGDAKCVLKEILDPEGGTLLPKADVTIDKGLDRGVGGSTPELDQDSNQPGGKDRLAE